MPPTEASFDRLVAVPVHYDRLPAPKNYGSKGEGRTFRCRNKLKLTLEECFAELFGVWGRGSPSLILTAGTIGDGENAHGQGFAFDLDGFYWGDKKFMMLDYPSNRLFYIGINAHLFLYFSQVLSYHYPQHKDHFHVDFNFSFNFRPASNAQTFFLQTCLKYIFGKDIGKTGIEHDGVDGVYGGDTKKALKEVLAAVGLSGEGGLTSPVVWKKFLQMSRAKAFA
jgi:hypothetical protein